MAYSPYPRDSAPSQAFNDIRLVMADLENRGSPEKASSVEAAKERLRMVDGVELLILIGRARRNGGGIDLGI